MTDPVQNLSVRDTVNIVSEALDELGGGPLSAEKLDQITNEADGIAYGLGDKYSKEQIQAAARNVKEAHAQTGGDLSTTLALLDRLNQHQTYSGFNMAEMNSSGTTASLFKLGDHNAEAFSRMFEQAFASIAELLGASNEGLRRARPDSESNPLAVTAREATRPVYERGTFGSAAQSVGGWTQGQGGALNIFKNILIDAGAGALGAEISEQLGGGKNAQNNTRIATQVFGGEVVKGLLNGQGPIQTLAGMDITRTVGELAGGYATTHKYRDRSELELAGRALLGTFGGGKVNDLVEGFLANRGGSNDIQIGSPQEYLPGRGGCTSIYNACSGFDIRSTPGIANMRLANEVIQYNMHHGVSGQTAYQAGTEAGYNSSLGFGR